MSDGKTLAQMYADDAEMMERIRHSQVARMDERKYGVCAREIEKIAQCLHLDVQRQMYVLSVLDVQMHMPWLRACLRDLKEKQHDSS